MRTFAGRLGTLDAGWEIVTVRPATTMVAERAAPVPDATVNGTVPEPVPLAVPTVTHEGMPVTCHAQPEPVVTVIVPVSPL
jgi:hypothetical protein